MILGGWEKEGRELNNVEDGKKNRSVLVLLKLVDALEKFSNVGCDLKSYRSIFFFLFKDS